MADRRVRGFAVVGPGRAGTTVALGLVAAGWQPRAVAGRSPEAASTLDASAVLECEPALVTEAARGAELVIIATPDAAIDGVAETIAETLDPGTLVIHLAGSRGLDALTPVAIARPDVRLGALHPLQTLPDSRRGLERLSGSWAAVAGDPETFSLASELGLRAFEIADEHRALYHAAAVVAANHLVALIGQVERMANAAGAPAAAFWPLMRASLYNAEQLGAAAALTGPVARGDFATVERHLAALAPAERDAYRAMAREAAKLVGHRPTSIDRLRRDL